MFDLSGIDMCRNKCKYINKDKGWYHVVINNFVTFHSFLSKRKEVV